MSVGEFAEVITIVTLLPIEIEFAAVAVTVCADDDTLIADRPVTLTPPI
jgi:hypothetical protein